MTENGHLYRFSLSVSCSLLFVRKSCLSLASLGSEEIFFYWFCFRLIFIRAKWSNDENGDVRFFLKKILLYSKNAIISEFRAPIQTPLPLIRVRLLLFHRIVDSDFRWIYQQRMDYGRERTRQIRREFFFHSL